MPRRKQRRRLLPLICGCTIALLVGLQVGFHGDAAPPAAAAPPARGTQTDARPGPEVVARADLAAAADGFAHPLAADVWRGRWRGRDVAVRRARDVDGFRRDVDALLRVRHRHVNPLLAFSLAPGAPLMAAPYLPGGSVAAALAAAEAAAALAAGARVRALADAGRGLAHLHGVHVCAGDVAAPTILLDADARARLCLAFKSSTFPSFLSPRRSSPDVNLPLVKELISVLVGILFFSSIYFNE